MSIPDKPNDDSLGKEEKFYSCMAQYSLNSARMLQQLPAEQFSVWESSQKSLLNDCYNILDDIVHLLDAREIACWPDAQVVRTLLDCIKQNKPFDIDLLIQGKQFYYNAADKYAGIASVLESLRTK